MRTTEANGRAIFFDVDGTLIDSRVDLASAVNATRAQLGLSSLPLEAVIACVGHGSRYLFEHAIPECTGRFDEIWPQYRQNYLAHLLDTTTLYPGVAETLHELSRRGWTLGINTSKPAPATHRILEHFGLAELFGAAVIAGGDCAELKPSAQPLVECAARVGHQLSPDDWMVGDSWMDLACAANAGIKGAFCDFGFGSLRDDSTFDARLACFEDLLNFI